MGPLTFVGSWLMAPVQVGRTYSGPGSENKISKRLVILMLQLQNMFKIDLHFYILQMNLKMNASS